MGNHTSNDIEISIRRIGAFGYDIIVRVFENPALQDDAMSKLDTLISSSNKEFLSTVAPWHIAYNAGRSYRYISGDDKGLDPLITAWIKVCNQKYGKNLRVEK
jgi:hypothetical protein